MKNGQWAAILATGTGVTLRRLFCLFDRLENGNHIGKVPTNEDISNGLSTPAMLANSQRIIERAYAGDLQGNLWKFDLNDSNEANWKVPYITNPGSVIDLYLRPVTIQFRSSLSPHLWKL
jgi:type IV pilus assembly protein PilY1